MVAGRGGKGALHIHAELEGAGQSSLGVAGNVERAARCAHLQVGGTQAAVSWQLEDLNTQLWSSVNLFHGLSREQKSEVKTALKKCRFRQGEKIVTQGDESQVFYIIEDGVCEVSVTVKDTDTGEVVHK